MGSGMIECIPCRCPVALTPAPVDFVVEDKDSVPRLVRLFKGPTAGYRP